MDVLASFARAHEWAGLRVNLTLTVLQEIPDKRRALWEIRRVLKPEGTLAVTEWLPDPDNPPRSTTIKQVQKEEFIMTSVQGDVSSYTVKFGKSQ